MLQTTHLTPLLYLLTANANGVSVFAFNTAIGAAVLPTFGRQWFMDKPAIRMSICLGYIVAIFLLVGMRFG